MTWCLWGFALTHVPLLVSVLLCIHSLSNKHSNWGLFCFPLILYDWFASFCSRRNRKLIRTYSLPVQLSISEQNPNSKSSCKTLTLPQNTPLTLLSLPSLGWIEDEPAYQQQIPLCETLSFWGAAVALNTKKQLAKRKEEGSTAKNLSAAALLTRACLHFTSSICVYWL